MVEVRDPRDEAEAVFFSGGWRMVVGRSERTLITAKIEDGKLYSYSHSYSNDSAALCIPTRTEINSEYPRHEDYLRILEDNKERINKLVEREWRW